MIPVSYTHLDVYKRQGKGCDVNELKCCRGKKFIRLLNNGEITEEKVKELKEQSKKREEFKKLPQEERLMPVSYTHLI